MSLPRQLRFKDNNYELLLFADGIAIGEIDMPYKRILYEIVKRYNAYLAQQAVIEQLMKSLKDISENEGNRGIRRRNKCSNVNIGSKAISS